MLYPCAITARRPPTHAVTACVVEATNRDEAIGKAMRIARKGYPAADGWADHFVHVNTDCNPIDPDSPVKVTVGG